MSCRRRHPSRPRRHYGRRHGRDGRDLLAGHLHGHIGNRNRSRDCSRHVSTIKQ